MAKAKGAAKIQGIANSLETLEITYVGVDDVKPNEYNPNRQSEHEFELLKRSIQDDGFTQPIIVQSPDAEIMPGRIVDGEHRWRAAASLGYKQIPVVYVRFSEEQMKVATIRHNTARGSHDVELEADLLRDLDRLGMLDFAQNALLLDDDEINRLVNDIQAPEGLADEEFDEAWEVGERGLSTEAEDVQSGATSHRTVASTPGAIEAQREREKRIREATTAEEKEQAMRDTGVFRFMLTLSKAEKPLVDAILGKEPAVKLVELLRAEAERQGIEV